MARPIRVEFKDAVYHVTARGNERRRIFRSDEDRVLFMETLAQMLGQFGVLLHVYCLMPNHYHLVLGTPRGNLSRAMGWFQTTYTVRYNRRHTRSGHLFQGRFKAHVVDADVYAQQLVSYIHLNPVRPKDKTAPLRPERKKELEEYRWSSHRDYAGLRQKPGWLNVDWLSYWGRGKSEAQRKYRREIGARFGELPDCPWARLRGGLVLGEERLWKKVNETIRDKEGQEETQWQKNEEDRERKGRINLLVDQEKDHRIRIWIKARLGGERLVDVGHELGYRNGSGVLQVMKRLEHAAQEDRQLQEKLRSLRKRLSSVES